MSAPQKTDSACTWSFAPAGSFGLSLSTGYTETTRNWALPNRIDLRWNANPGITLSAVLLAGYEREEDFRQYPATSVPDDTSNRIDRSRIAFYPRFQFHRSDRTFSVNPLFERTTLDIDYRDEGAPFSYSLSETRLSYGAALETGGPRWKGIGGYRRTEIIGRVTVSTTAARTNQWILHSFSAGVSGKFSRGNSTTILAGSLEKTLIALSLFNKYHSRFDLSLPDWSARLLASGTWIPGAFFLSWEGLTRWDTEQSFSLGRNKWLPAYYSLTTAIVRPGWTIGNWTLAVDGTMTVSWALEDAKRSVHSDLSIGPSIECRIGNWTLGFEGFPSIDWDSNPSDKRFEWTNVLLRVSAKL
jgi:hypothetical protein